MEIFGTFSPTLNESAHTVSGIALIPRTSRNGNHYTKGEIASGDGARVPVNWEHRRSPEFGDAVIGEAVFKYDPILEQLRYTANITNEKAIERMKSTPRMFVSIEAKVGKNKVVCNERLGDCFNMPSGLRFEGLAITERPGVPETTVNAVSESVHRDLVNEMVIRVEEMDDNHNKDDISNPDQAYNKLITRKDESVITYIVEAVLEEMGKKPNVSDAERDACTCGAQIGTEHDDDCDIICKDRKRESLIGKIVEMVVEELRKPDARWRDGGKIKDSTLNYAVGHFSKRAAAGERGPGSTAHKAIKDRIRYELRKNDKDIVGGDKIEAIVEAVLREMDHSTNPKKRADYEDEKDSHYANVIYPDVADNTRKRESVIGAIVEAVLREMDGESPDGAQYDDGNKTWLDSRGNRRVHPGSFTPEQLATFARKFGAAQTYKQGDPKGISKDARKQVKAIASEAVARILENDGKYGSAFAKRFGAHQDDMDQKTKYNYTDLELEQIKKLASESVARILEDRGEDFKKWNAAHDKVNRGKGNEITDDEREAGLRYREYPKKRVEAVVGAVVEAITRSCNFGKHVTDDEKKSWADAIKGLEDHDKHMHKTDEGLDNGRHDKDCTYYDDAPYIARRDRDGWICGTCKSWITDRKSDSLTGRKAANESVCEAWADHMAARRVREASNVMHDDDNADLKSIEKFHAKLFKRYGNTESVKAVVEFMIRESDKKGPSVIGGVFRNDKTGNPNKKFVKFMADVLAGDTANRIRAANAEDERRMDMKKESSPIEAATLDPRRQVVSDEKKKDMDRIAKTHGFNVKSESTAALESFREGFLAGVAKEVSEEVDPRLIPGDGKKGKPSVSIRRVRVEQRTPVDYVDKDGKTVKTEETDDSKPKWKKDQEDAKEKTKGSPHLRLRDGKWNVESIRKLLESVKSADPAIWSDLVERGRALESVADMDDALVIALAETLVEANRPVIRLRESYRGK